MGNLCRCATAHKAVINQIVLVGPTLYLIGDKFFWKYCWMLEGNFIL